jgi:hypothetical protein
MSGTINISRRLFDSEAFRDEPFTEREAWVWLLMEASWKDRTVRAGDYVTETKRGQLAASVRFMAKAWSWTPAKVQRYLKRVEKLKMICSKTDTGVSVLTICNYDKYQNGAKSSDTCPIQDRYTTDTNEKKDVKKKEGKELVSSGDNTGNSKFLDEVSQAVSAYNDAAERAGWPSVKKVSPDRRRHLVARIKDAGGIDGWQKAIARAEASSFLTGRTDRPFSATFDFIIKQANFTKIIEGNYDDRQNKMQGGLPQKSGGHFAGAFGFIPERG